jgi:hypothetical protein
MHTLKERSVSFFFSKIIDNKVASSKSATGGREKMNVLFTQLFVVDKITVALVCLGVGEQTVGAELDEEMLTDLRFHR